MRILITSLIILTATTCQAIDWTANVLGSADNDIVAGAGAVFAEGSEVGLSVASYDTEGDRDITVGPYLATALEIPSPWPGEDVGTYVGISPQFDTDSWKPLVELFGAAILYPDRQVTPVAVYKYSWLDGGLASEDTDIVSGSAIYFGLRVKF